ncbi:MAG: SipW-dependent-type signal peptide-containing protein [Lachnospiraceae bacterium]
MSKKKVAAMVVSLALVAVVGIGATLAYFTDKTDIKKNVVTMGNVDISLTETTVAADGKEGVTDVPNNGLKFDNVMPGDVLSKKPVVTVAGTSEDAYVRVMITPQVSGNSFTDAQVMGFLNIDPADWVKGTDGYYYYQAKVTKGEALAPVFTTVTIPADLGNKYAMGSFNISIQAEAIQAANVTPTMSGTQITGWPAATIEEYK